MFAKIKLFLMGMFGIFAWKAGKDHAENKQKDATIENVSKASRAKCDPNKRKRVRDKYKR